MRPRPMKSSAAYAFIGGRTTMRCASSSSASARSMATRCCSTATASSRSCRGFSRASCRTSTSAPPAARAARRAFAPRCRACSTGSRTTRTWSTAASRAATSPATTGSPHRTCMRCSSRCAGAATWPSRRRTSWIRSAPSACCRCCRRWRTRCCDGHRMADAPMRRTLWAPRAWLQGRWHDDVRLDIAVDGTWAGITPGTSREQARDAEVLNGPVLPGMVNAHSHAFQRAFAGLAERRDGAHDDFWSWRDRMYGVALTITPERLRDVATRLYVELLRGGYTQVCEFHYLHHAPDGSRHGDPLTMIRALVDAAQSTGIGLTVLPVLYERAGFTMSSLRDDQRRFAASSADVLALRDGVRALNAAHVNAGVAIHS